MVQLLLTAYTLPQRSVIGRVITVFEDMITTRSIYEACMLRRYLKNREDGTVHDIGSVMLSLVCQSELER